MANLEYFVRAEVKKDGRWDSDRLHYVWRCKNCGNEYSQTKPNNQTNLCSKCLYAYQEEKRIKSKRKAEEVALKRIVNQLKKKVKVGEMPTVTINGNVYCERNAFEKTLDDIYASCLKDGD